MVKMFEIVFSFNVKDNDNIHVYIILDFPVTYRNAPVICESECASRYKTVNMVVKKFFVNSNENTYSKGRALMQMYKIVPITKRGNSLVFIFSY